MVKQRQPAPKKATSLEQFAASVEGQETKDAPWAGLDPKAARYKAGNAKAKAMTLGFNEYEYARLIEASARANRKPLDFIRNAVKLAVDQELETTPQK